MTSVSVPRTLVEKSSPNPRGYNTPGVCWCHGVICVLLLGNSSTQRQPKSPSLFSEAISNFSGSLPWARARSTLPPGQIHFYCCVDF